jgi:hypothetical protein
LQTSLTADVLRLQKNTVAEITHVSDCNFIECVVAKAGKGGLQKKHTPCRIKKEGAQKYIARVQIHKIKQKKGRKKLPHHMI